MDGHNHISTTDTRLIRRLVRDKAHRGASAETTLNMWASVLRGENTYIFPHQDKADALFNSALPYEMAILRPYVLPLLFAVKNNAPLYTEARRSIKFMDGFLGVGSDIVPKNSILREFLP
jgi:uridine kinase